MVTESYTNGYYIKKTETDTQVQAAAHDLGNPRRLVAADQADPREVLASELTGRRHANWRLILNGIIFRMRSGCQWDQLPRKFGPKSTVHDWFQRRAPTAWGGNPMSGRKSGVRGIRCQRILWRKSGVSSSFLPEKTN